MKIYLNQDFTKVRNDDKLNPWAVTGLCDSEGSFTCNVSKTGKGITGYSVKLEFKVTQKRHSEGMLYELRDFFGCGTVVIDNRISDTNKYHVTSLQAILTKIIPHFDIYPCLTSKQLNFNDWKKIALFLIKKEHLSSEGLKEVIKIDNGLNSKRTFEEKFHFCKNSLNLQHNGESNFDLSPYWVQGFLSGESVFYNYIAEKKSRGNTYQSCDSSLEVAQNSHDVGILLALKRVFKGGYIKPKYNVNDILQCKKSRTVNRYILRDTNTIIKYVDNYPVLTRKYLDYADWKKIVQLKESQAHKTEDGLKLMLKIKNQMNLRRKDLSP